MLYETLLKKLKKRRASNFKGAQGLTALEVSYSFSGELFLLIIRRCVASCQLNLLGPEGPEPITYEYLKVC